MRKSHSTNQDRNKPGHSHSSSYARLRAPLGRVGGMTSEFSFRDPAGRVVIHNGRIVRLVRRDALAPFERFLSSALYDELRQRGQVVDSHPLQSSEVTEVLRAVDIDPAIGDFAAAFEHPRIPFFSYPDEWPAGMLYAAAKLTLDVAEAALRHGWGLKDATPFNIGFVGPRPVLVDVLSFEPRDPTDATWLAYAQFVRTFLLPLLAGQQLGLTNRALFAESREGLEPEAVSRLLPLNRKLRGPGLSLVTIPALLRRTAGDGVAIQNRHASSPEKAKFILEALFRHLRGSLEKVKIERQQSRWSSYSVRDVHSQEYISAKRRVVSEMLDELTPKAVLDLGCNVGHLSLLAAESGARVVAVDADAAVVEATFRRAVAHNRDILPLVVDLADPTPARGWRNEEQSSFLTRATGSFQLVMALALVHHLLLSAGVPITSIVKLLEDLSTELVLVEHVPPGDPMFRLLARGREVLHPDATRDAFVAALGRNFDIVRSQPLPSSEREVFLLRKRAR